MTNEPVEPRDASTVLLIRDGKQTLEVFMVVRHPNIEFAAGALVFPGGAVDGSDRIAAKAGAIPIQCRDLDDRERAWRVAAVREVYEECGVLLARPCGATTLVDSDRLARISRTYAEELSGHALDVASLAKEQELELALDALVPFAHWVTPASRPKRFDTRFYLAVTPPNQVARHDGHESVHSLWARANQVGREADEGLWHLRFPTRMNLEKLSKSDRVEEALSAAQAAPVVKVVARSELVSGGNRVFVPHEAGYGLVEALVDEKGKIVSKKTPGDE